MTSELNYVLAFTAGVLASGHCVGMCGALVSSFFMKVKRGDIRLYAAYHGARISVYMLLGVLAALLGVTIASADFIGKIQGVLQIFVGLLVILLALDMLKLLPWRLSFSILPKHLLRQGLSTATTRGAVTGAAMAGMVNGLMPCPLTLSMAVTATTAGNPTAGGLLMLAFGVGTLPSMLFVSVVFSKLSTKARGYMLKGAAVIVMVMGIMTTTRGIMFSMAVQG